MVRKQRGNVESYFLAGRTMPWFAVSILPKVHKHKQQQRRKFTRMPISNAELSFFAVSLNLCLCLKSSPITVDIWQEVQQNDVRKSKESPFFSIKKL